MPAAAEPVATPAIRGAVDGLSETRIAGWAYEAAQPDERLVVELRLAGARVAATVADLPRPDLSPAGAATDGFHGFAFALKPDWVARWDELEVVALGAEGGETPLGAADAAPEPDAPAGEAAADAAAPAAARIAALEARIAALEAWVVHLDGRAVALEKAPPAPARVALPLWQQALLVLFGLVGLGAIGIVVTALAM